jgi:hypothetical protein
MDTAWHEKQAISAMFKTVVVNFSYHTAFEAVLVNFSYHTVFNFSAFNEDIMFLPHKLK